MTKSKNSDIKSNNVKENVLEKSKIIKKNKKKSLEDKKKVQQAVTKNVEDHTTTSSNGNTESDAIVKRKRPKKNKSKQNKTTDGTSVKDSSNKSLEIIEKKKAKKLAKKLKKKEKKEAKKNEAVKKATKGKENNVLAEKNLKSKSLLEKDDKSDSKEKKEDDPIKAASTVFVGNLPVNTKRAQLIRLFKDYGPVNGIRFRSANGKILFKHKHRKEAGTLSAWVILKDAETVTHALDLNGTVFKNNHLRITRGDVLYSNMDTKRTIFVGNLKYSANEEKLREIFSACGDIEYVRCLNDDKGCKGVAYVCFKAPEAVGLALELNETILDERPIHVERYSVKKLGAKKTRDVAGGEIKIKSGGAKIQKDKTKKVKGDNLNTKQGSETNKKSKFRGVKVEGTHVKKQKKKVTSQMQKLAKKIAPKEKS